MIYRIVITCQGRCKARSSAVAKPAVCPRWDTDTVVTKCTLEKVAQGRE